MLSSQDLEYVIPLAPLKLIAADNCIGLGKKTDEYIIKMREKTMLPPSHPAHDIQGYRTDTYLCSYSCPRSGSGEAKGIINSSVRGVDLFILTDVMNHSLTYKVNGQTNYMSPDDHFQDLKRIIAAVNGKARRITVIMPFLYESRQHKRMGRESLDCALALEELQSMGVSGIITFDAHDARVQNSIPLCGFDTFNTYYQFFKALLRAVPDLVIDKDHLMIISPDEGAMHRAIYCSNILGVDMGMFYKRRDYSQIINGMNPIVAHEFLGSDLEGKDVFIIDDMISSGGSMLDVAKQLKERRAGRIFIAATFGLFTNGLEKFDRAYEEGLFDGVVTTNLTYLLPELYERPYFIEADLSKYLAYIINAINHNVPVNQLLDPTQRLKALVEKHKALL